MKLPSVQLMTLALVALLVPSTMAPAAPPYKPSTSSSSYKPTSAGYQAPSAAYKPTSTPCTDEYAPTSANYGAKRPDSYANDYSGHSNGNRDSYNRHSNDNQDSYSGRSNDNRDNYSHDHNGRANDSRDSYSGHSSNHDSYDGRDYRGSNANDYSSRSNDYNSGGDNYQHPRPSSTYTDPQAYKKQAAEYVRPTSTVQYAPSPTAHYASGSCTPNTSICISSRSYYYCNNGEQETRICPQGSTCRNGARQAQCVGDSNSSVVYDAAPTSCVGDTSYCASDRSFYRCEDGTRKLHTCGFQQECVTYAASKVTCNVSPTDMYNRTPNRYPPAQVTGQPGYDGDDNLIIEV